MHPKLISSAHFKAFENLMLQSVESYSTKLKLDRDMSHFSAYCWGAVHDRESQFHDKHYHRNAGLSTIFYLRAPKGSGKTVFEDPRIGLAVYGYEHVLEPKQG